MAFNEQDAIKLAHAAQYMLQTADELEEFIENECDEGPVALSRQVVSTASTLEIGLGILRNVLTDAVQEMIEATRTKEQDLPEGYGTIHHWGIVAGESCLESLTKQIEPPPEQPKSSEQWLALMDRGLSLRPLQSRSCQKYGIATWMEIAPKVVLEATCLVEYLQNAAQETASMSTLGRSKISDQTIQNYLAYRREFELARQQDGFDREQFLKTHRIDSAEHKRRLNHTTRSKLLRRGISFG